jgi:hypothetical protein
MNIPYHYCMHTRAVQLWSTATNVDLFVMLIETSWTCPFFYNTERKQGRRIHMLVSCAQY